MNELPEETPLLKENSGCQEKCTLIDEKVNVPSRGITLTLCFSVFGAIVGTSFVIGFNLAVVNNPAVR